MDLPRCPSVVKVLETLQRIQAVDPSQRGAVGYLVQHTLEHIHHKKHPVTPDVKNRNAPENSLIRYSVGLIMRHKRSVVFRRSTPTTVNTSNPACPPPIQVWV